MSSREEHLARIKEEIVATARAWYEADLLATINDPEIAGLAADTRAFDEAMEERDRQEVRLRDLVPELEKAEKD